MTVKPLPHIGGLDRVLCEEIQQRWSLLAACHRQRVADIEARRT